MRVDGEEIFKEWRRGSRGYSTIRRLGGCPNEWTFEQLERNFPRSPISVDFDLPLMIGSLFLMHYV